MLNVRCLLAGILLVGIVSTPLSAQPTTATETTTPPQVEDAAPHAEGFIQNWMILEPIPLSDLRLTQSGVQSVVRRAHFDGQLTILPRPGDVVTVDGTKLTWHAVATPNYNINTYHFAHRLGRPTSNVLFWGVTVIYCPDEMPGVRLAIGSNAASVWWVNGTEVIGNYLDRQTVIDDAVSKRLTLRKGANVVRFALINAGGATDFCARFLGPDEKPLTQFTVPASTRPAVE